MSLEILLEILFELLSKRKLTAAYFAEKHGISIRTVYRYISRIEMCVPVSVTRGRNGGISISDSYKLPVGFMTKEEYGAAIEALTAMYAQLPEEKYLDAKHKLTSQLKTEMRDVTLTGNVGSIIVDSGTWGDTRKFSEKLRLIEECIQEKAVLEINYHSRLGESSKRKIEPHALVFKQNVWYVYAFCRKQLAFRLFHLGRIFSSFVTGEKFNRRPFKREDIPLNFWATEQNSIDVRFEVNEKAFTKAQDWLGGENFIQKDGKWYIEATLPSDEGLAEKIVSLGGGIKVLSPDSLAEKVRSLADEICKQYE